MLALSSPSFRHTVWAFPILLALHFLEEAPGFAFWAQRFASPLYTRAHWARIHGLELICGIVGALAVSRFPNSHVAFFFLAFCVGPMAFNALFHFGATAYFRAYCPGVITAVAFFPLFAWHLVHLALRDRLLSPAGALVGLLIAGPLHALDVASTVFFVRPFASHAGSLKHR